MRLICYPIGERRPDIRCAPVERSWMSASFAHRCLPLNVANSFGWQLLNPVPFIAAWGGSEDKRSVQIVPVAREDEVLKPTASSHFGSGILTFSTDALFRTDPGYNLWVTGPLNELKRGIQPLTGIVETDWLPFTFTMNWKFTDANVQIEFDRGEPFCTIFVVPRGLTEKVEPSYADLADDPVLGEQYRAWRESRDKFNAELKTAGSDARQVQWQKHYFRGTDIQGNKITEHRTRLRQSEFR